MDAKVLPNNVDGYRTTFTCELCGFEPKTKNKYRERKHHLVTKHFKERIDQEIPNSEPFSCLRAGCVYVGSNKETLFRHAMRQHNLLKIFICEALAEKGIPYSVDDDNRRRKRKLSDPTEKKQVSSRFGGHEESKSEHFIEFVPSSGMEEWRRNCFGNPDESKQSQLVKGTHLDAEISPVKTHTGGFFETSGLGHSTQFTPELIFSPFGNVLNFPQFGGQESISHFSTSRNPDPLNLSTGNQTFVRHDFQDNGQAVVHAAAIGPISEAHYARVAERDLDFLDVLERQIGFQF